MSAHNKCGRIAIFLLVAAVFLSGEIRAADKKYAVSQQTYKVLEKSRKLMDQAKYPAALNQLQALLPKVADKHYEFALVHQHIAYIYLEQGNYAQGLLALEKTLEYADTLPKETVQNLRYNLAQSAAQTENYQKAEQALDRWFAEEKRPSADAWYLRGLVQFKRQHSKQAVDFLNRALSMSFHENWAVLLLSIHLELKEFSNAALILKQLVNAFPEKKEYWNNLCDVYLMTENYKRALAVLRLAAHRVRLDEKEHIKLAHLYMHQGIPLAAAQLLQRAIDTRQVHSNASNFELLANSWAAARDPEKELVYLQRAAKLRNDGNLYYRCAQILLRMEKWRDAVQMLDSALASKLQSPGQSYLLKGIAAYQAGLIQTAIQAFQRAGQFDNTRNQAKAWLSQVKASKLES